MVIVNDAFEVVRKWVYKAIREYWKPNYQDEWSNAVLARCEAVNLNYIQPVPPSEVRSIAKSIAKWTMAHFTPQRFSESQAKKGRKSKGGGRPIDTTSETQQKPWEALGISRATYFRRKKSGLV